MSDLSESIRTQIDELSLDSNRPLLLCDADEVLFQFVRGLERHIETQGFHLDLISFSLFGNIKHAVSGEVASRDQVAGLLKGFFATQLPTLDPVPGAAKALAAIAEDAQVVVLTNTPPPRRADRAEALVRGGMPYPVIANEGAKGAAAGAIAGAHKAPVVFIDDIPHNIDSVLEAVTHAKGIHFVADPRLRPMIPKAPSALHRVDEWPEAEPLIRAALQE
jgi:hypothetical protein